MSAVEPTDDRPTDATFGRVLTEEEASTVAHYRLQLDTHGPDGLLRILFDRDRTVAAYRDAVNVAEDQRRTAETRLAAFKERVAEVTRDFDGGCIDGKTQFLEELGLKYPHQTWTVEVSYSFTGPEPSEYDIAYEISRAIDCNDDVNVSVSENY